MCGAIASGPRRRHHDQTAGTYEGLVRIEAEVQRQPWSHPPEPRLLKLAMAP